MKTGYKTTEFWITAIVVLAGAAVGSGLIPADSPWAQFASLVVSGFAATRYTDRRTEIKKGQVDNPFTRK